MCLAQLQAEAGDLGDYPPGGCLSVKCWADLDADLSTPVATLDWLGFGYEIDVHDAYLDGFAFAYLDEDLGFERAECGHGSS